jgi:hypothetical protein
MGFYSFDSITNKLKFLLKYWRASLVPAAAVIPAPVASSSVAAVKKLVVEFWNVFRGLGFGQALWEMFFWPVVAIWLVTTECGKITMKKLESLNQACA